MGAGSAGFDLFHGLVPLLSLAGTGDVAPDWLLDFCCGAGGLVGGYLGAHLQPHLPDPPLRLLNGTLATSFGTLYAVQIALTAHGSALIERGAPSMGPFPLRAVSLAPGLSARRTGIRAASSAGPALDRPRGGRQPMPPNQQTGQRNRPGNTLGLTPAAPSRPLYGPWVFGTTRSAVARTESGNLKHLLRRRSERLDLPGTLPDPKPTSSGFSPFRRS